MSAGLMVRKPISISHTKHIERERAVWVDLNDRRRQQPRLQMRGARVELLRKVHCLDTLRAKRRPYWWLRRCLPSGHKELDHRRRGSLATGLRHAQYTATVTKKQRDAFMSRDASRLKNSRWRRSTTESMAEPARVYTVSGAGGGDPSDASYNSSSLPDLLRRSGSSNKRKKRRGAAENDRLLSKIELIQDFEFPEASIKIRATRDGQNLVATGTYKPQVRVWDCEQLSLKFERHTTAENIDFVVR